MNIKQKILSDLKEAMKSGNAVKRDTLRMVDSMIKNTEIDKMKKEEGLNDEETIGVISRAIKQRKDSASQYEAGGRAELAEREKNEIEILMAYMPKQMEDAEIRSAVKEIISETKATTKADIGKVMGVAMSKLKGKAEGNSVKKIVEEELA